MAPQLSGVISRLSHCRGGPRLVCWRFGERAGGLRWGIEAPRSPIRGNGDRCDRVRRCCLRDGAVSALTLSVQLSFNPPQRISTPSEGQSRNDYAGQRPI